MAEKEYKIQIRKITDSSFEILKRRKKESIIPTCKLLGLDKQVYYENIKQKNKQIITYRAILPVRSIRNLMPHWEQENFIIYSG